MDRYAKTNIAGKFREVQRIAVDFLWLSLGGEPVVDSAEFHLDESLKSGRAPIGSPPLQQESLTV